MKLYLFTENMGDGESSVQATFDKEFVLKAQCADDYPYDPFEDFGEGGMTIINVPEGSTAESLGLHSLREEGDWV
jgi:hypothetical protein